MHLIAMARTLGRKRTEAPNLLLIIPQTDLGPDPRRRRRTLSRPRMTDPIVVVKRSYERATRKANVTWRPGTELQLSAHAAGGDRCREHARQWHGRISAKQLARALTGPPEPGARAPRHRPVSHWPRSRPPTTHFRSRAAQKRRHAPAPRVLPAPARPAFCV